LENCPDLGSGQFRLGARSTVEPEAARISSVAKAKTKNSSSKLPKPAIRLLFHSVPAPVAIVTPSFALVAKEAPRIGRWQRAVAPWTLASVSKKYVRPRILLPQILPQQKSNEMAS
jgi:hypothetical protein